MEPNSPIPSQIPVVVPQNEESGKFSPLKNKIKIGWDTLKSRWNNLTRKKKIIVSGLVGVLVVSAVLLLSPKGQEIVDRIINRDGNMLDDGNWTKLQIPERQPSFFKLTSTTNSFFGILPRQEFILETLEPVDESFIQENIISNVPVSVSSQTAQKFTLMPQRELPLDDVLSIQLDVKNKGTGGVTFDRNYSWAFQTQSKFAVVSTIPGDEKTNVPVNTGIEFVFNQDEYNDPTPFISIDPPIKFRVEQHNETVAVVPIDPLEYMTVYTVTLRSGLGLENRNDTLSENVSFTFQTEDKPKSHGWLSVHEDFHQVSTKEPAAVKIYKQNWSNDTAIKTNIYKFSSTDEFLQSRSSIDSMQSWWSYYSAAHEVDTNSLTKVGEVELKVQNREEIDYLQLPQALSSGLYFVRFDLGNGNFEQLWLQSTDISGYVSVGKEQTVVWVNEVGNGAVPSAQVRPVGENSSYSTNDQGWTIFSSPQSFFNEGRHYVEVTSDNGNLLLPVPNLSDRSGPGDQTADDYWSYLYHERQLYKPGDTVYFWGVAKNRNTNQPPSSITIQINQQYGYEGGQSAIAEQIVVPQADGSYIGSIQLGTAQTGWFYLNAIVNGVQISSSGLSILQYSKPEMKIEVTADKKAVFVGDSVEFSIKTLFFDGTPASHTSLNVSGYYYGGDNEKIKTDANGEAKYTLTTGKGGRPNTLYEGIVVRPLTTENANVEGHGSVMVYGSELMIDTENSQEAHTAHLKAVVNKVDLSGVNAGTTSNVKGDFAKNQKVKLKTTMTWYEQKEIGTYYDFVEKTTRKKYQYLIHDEVIEEKEFTTNNQGEIMHQFSMEESKSYSVEVWVTDSKGREAKASEYYYYRNDSRSFSTDSVRKPELSLNEKSNEYSVGQQVQINILYQGENYPDTDSNRFLFIKANRGNQQVNVSDSPSYSFEFSNSDIPNVYVGAVIFTGDTYEIVSSPCKWNWYCYGYDYYNFRYYFDGIIIKYKKTDSELNLDIRTSQEKYGPGDEAQVFVDVTKNGSPVPNATVNLTLVDEALAAMGSVIEPTPLTSLYKDVANSIYYSYHSHKALVASPPQAEKGGGGGDREVFKDAAFFAHAKTNEAGQAVFTFTLPDNITSWVTYAQAITGNVDAGHTESSIIATKKFFITNHFPPEVLTTDKAFVTSSAYGVLLSENDNINYETVFFSGNNEIQRKNEQGKAFTEISFPFPQLNVGNYSVAARGRFGNQEDGVRLPLSVVDTRLEFEHQQQKSLVVDAEVSFDEIDAVEGKPITLVITDTGKGKYYYTLSSYCNTGSNRVEKRIAQIIASKVLEERFDDEFCDPTVDFSMFQSEDGGIGQVSWGGSNLETTLWATYANAELFDTEKLETYFNLMKPGVYVDPNSPQGIYSYWGLSLLDVPHIKELRAKATTVSSPEGKILTALALATNGETELAREMYFDILAEYGYENKPYIRIQTGDANMDTYLKNTSMVLLLGSIVEQNYNEGLHLYLRDYQTAARDIVTDIADISFINNELAKLPDEDTLVSLISNLKNREFDLSKGNSARVEVTENELTNLDLTLKSGKADAILTYYLNPDKAKELQEDSRIGIEKSYKKVSGDGDSIKTGDIVEVKVSYNIDKDNAPVGSYLLVDHIPSGFTYIENPYLYGLGGYKSRLYKERHNVVHGHAYNSPWWYQYSSNTAYYWVRATAPGEYLSEPAIIQSQLDKTIFDMTEQETITIQPR